LINKSLFVIHEKKPRIGGKYQYQAAWFAVRLLFGRRTERSYQGALFPQIEF
jgi:hypothetical protein